MAFISASKKKLLKKKKDNGKVKKYRKKVCKLCAERDTQIEYKDVTQLQRFVTEKGAIISRRITGTCSRHQRVLTKAIKRARQVSLLPYTVL